jgi:hypothetical protein
MHTEFTARELHDAAFAAANQLLAEFGFKKRKAGIFSGPTVSPDCIGWLGLNSASRKVWGVDFNPFVGVRHQPLERLFAALEVGPPFHAYIPATIAHPLYALVPGGHYRPWNVERPDEAESVMRDMVDHFRDFGLPYIAANSTLSGMIERLRLGDGPPFHGRERLCLALALVGQDAEARVALEESLQKLGSHTDPGAERFRAFGKAFLAWLDGPRTE